MRQLWIPDQLKRFGLKFYVVDGWTTRGADTLKPRGVVAHHTGGPATGEIPELSILIKGRSDLPGPLCNVALGRSGTCYVVAAGKANHAGSGGWKGLSGNSSVLGIEPANNGNQVWPTVQYEAYVRLCAALISGPGVGGDPGMVCGHREWTTRKNDPHGIDMPTFRTQIKKVLSNPNPAPVEEDEEMGKPLLVQKSGHPEVYQVMNDHLEWVKNVDLPDPVVDVFQSRFAGQQVLILPESHELWTTFPIR